MCVCYLADFLGVKQLQVILVNLKPRVFQKRLIGY